MVVVHLIMPEAVVEVTTVVVLDMLAAAAVAVQVLQITKQQASLKLKGLNQEMVL
jgi:phosphoribosylcarboxyaminoimidazole (NCAIR) mutase